MIGQTYSLQRVPQLGGMEERETHLLASWQRTTGGTLSTHSQSELWQQHLHKHFIQTLQMNNIFDILCTKKRQLWQMLEKQHLNGVGQKTRWRHVIGPWGNAIPWRRLSLYRILPCRTLCRSLAEIHQIVKRQTRGGGEVLTHLTTSVRWRALEKC